MIKSFSNLIINYLIRKDIIDTEVEVYQYGLELLLSSVIGVVLILFISICTNRLIEGLIYLFSFMIIRKYTGGYHCKSYFSCKSSFIGIFLVYLLSVHFISASLYLHTLTALSVLTIWILAPCDHENKILSAEERSRYGNISKCIICIYSLVIYIGYQAGSMYSVCMEMMLVIIAVLLIIGKIERRITYEKS